MYNVFTSPKEKNAQEYGGILKKHFTFFIIELNIILLQIPVTINKETGKNDVLMAFMNLVLIVK